MAQTRANVFTWSGGGVDGYWSDSANWGGAGTPNFGDSVVFPAGKPRLLNTNNFSGLILADIRFTGGSGGYDLYGSSFTLTNSIQATNTSGVNTIFPDIILATTNIIVNVSNGASLLLDGDLSGSVGLVKTGAGTLEFSGAPPNSYEGTTWVNTGALILNRNGINTAFSGPLVISDGSASALVQLAQSLELPGWPITINQGGTLDLNSHQDKSGPLITLNGNGSIKTETGTLTLPSDTTIAANPGFFENSSISGNLNVGSGSCTFAAAFSLGSLSVTASISGSATINIVSNGYMTLGASNSFTGPLNILDASTLVINNSFSLGATNSGVTISNSAALNFNTALAVTGKSLIDASSNPNGSLNMTDEGSGTAWIGPVTLAMPVSMSIVTNSGLYLEQQVSGPGGITVVGTGSLILFGPGNTYTGITTVTPGAILDLWTAAVAVPANLVVGGTVSCITEYQLGASSDLDILAGGVFHAGSSAQSCFTLNGNGTLDLGTMAMAVDSDYGTFSEFDGVITNSGDFYVQYGTVTLTGYNTYTGTTRVWDGFLVVNGYQPYSPMDVQYGGMLLGIGSVGLVNCSGGSLAPGNSLGVLSVENVSLTNQSYYYAHLDGSFPGTSYNQLYVQPGSQVNITGSSLYVDPEFHQDDGPTNGQQYVIINNPSGTLTGTFTGLPDGSIYTAFNGMQFRVGYNKLGQSVVLTYTNPPTQQVSASVSAGNGSGYIEPNECANIYLTLQNPGPTIMSGVSGILRSLTPGVAVTQGQSPFPDVPAGGSSTNLAPFQIHTMPWLDCSAPITLQAVFSNGISGVFSVPFTFQGGVPLQFDNVTPFPIPDQGSITSAVPVSGLTAPIAKVDVLMYLTHSYDNDLTVDLIAPDGTTVNLVNHDGQNGQDFGSACGSADTETIFDDFANASITSGVAPFVGSFSPASPLSALIGKSVASVNNKKWNLHVSDTEQGNTGTLQCWSLRLWPGACPDGGGLCELCPNTTIYGMLGTNNPMTDRLTRTGDPSSCAAPNPCPGDYGEADFYDAYTFRNGPSDACVTVTLDSPSTDAFSAAYLNYLDPNDACSNYLADAGVSTLYLYPYPPVLTYSFNVAADALFVVTVNGINGSTGPYAVSVEGGSCQPELNINPGASNNVALSWTTAAGGYLLESTNSLSASPAWQTVTTPPVVAAGQFVVTNPISTSSQFYRLRKPE